MGTWAGRKREDESTDDGPVRRGLPRMGTWAGKKDERGAGQANADVVKKGKKQDDDDDRIRFTIGGAGKRMTKEDFLKQVRDLDPKTRAEIVADSNAPEEMKELARKDAKGTAPGTSRLLGAQIPQLGASHKEAQIVGAAMAKQRGAAVDDDDQVHGHKDEGQETQVERRRREQVLEGVDDDSSTTQSHRNQRETPAERRRREAAIARGMTSVRREQAAVEDTGETQAEKRRREAALGVGEDSDEDSEDDNTERVVPQTRTRGIRFAEDPIRGRR